MYHSTHHGTFNVIDSPESKVERWNSYNFFKLLNLAKPVDSEKNKRAFVAFRPSQKNTTETMREQDVNALASAILLKEATSDAINMFKSGDVYTTALHYIKFHQTSAHVKCEPVPLQGQRWLKDAYVLALMVAESAYRGAGHMYRDDRHARPAPFIPGSCPSTYSSHSQPTKDEYFGSLLPALFSNITSSARLLFKIFTTKSWPTHLDAMTYLKSQ